MPEHKPTVELTDKNMSFPVALMVHNDYTSFEINFFEFRDFIEYKVDFFNVE